MVATLENSRDILLQVHSIKREFEVLAQSWKRLGASALAIIRQEQVLMSIPAKTLVEPNTLMLKAPLRLGEDILLLCVVGINDVRYQPRLFADAQLLHGLLRREQEIAVMADELVLYQDQLLALYELNHSLRFQTKLQNILRIAAQQTRKITQSDYAFVLYDTGDIPNHAQSGNNQLGLEEIKTWYEQMLLQSKELLRIETVNSGIYVLLIPIESEGKSLGCLGIANASKDFDMPTVKVAITISEQVCTHIQKAIFYQERLQQERIAAEMNLARDVQMSLLPSVPKAGESLDIWAMCNPAQEVGGDFYEFSNRVDSLHFSLGDVAGKGLSAALLMAMSRTVLKVLSEKAPQETLERFNQHLYEDFSQVGSFVTLFTASYNLESHMLSYANAGHAPVIYCPRDGDARMLEADSPPIGVLPEALAQEHQIQMNLGDILVVSSDGIPEATHLMGTMFGYENMMRLIELYRDRSAKTISDLLLETANIHQLPNDDQTIIVIKRVK
jgi:sigma-B regulation protein RsbU (phosphoserine phosphatase)